MLTITVDDKTWLAREIAKAVMQSVYEEGSIDMVGDAIDRAVRARIDEAVDEMLPDMLRPKIAEALEGDFGSVDFMGRHSPRTLRAMIVDYFSPNGRSAGHSKISEQVEARVREIMKEEFQPAIDAARKSLRDRIDSILGEKVSLAVREAVGLR